MKLNAHNLIDEIIRIIPAYKSYSDFDPQYLKDENLKNLLVDIFGRFLKERVENYSVDDEIIQKSYLFINEQFNNSKINKDVKDLLIIDIFENLATSYKAIEVSRKLLKDKALEAFNEAEKYI